MKHLEIELDENLRKNNGYTRTVDNMHIFVVCQIDVVNKQLVLNLVKITCHQKYH